jgi:NAD(P)-dependent dehydrogenase (short-subunit alcohol dehydrogenase family)
MLETLFNFKNKVILITGCGGQIGLKTSNLFLSLGAKVYGFDIKLSKINNKNFFYMKTDITKNKILKKNIDKIFKKEKKIDIVINNAATSIYTDIEKRNDKELNNVYSLNVLSAINVIKYFYINYKKYNLKTASIINIGSIYGFLSPEFKIYKNGERFSAEIYGASKASIIQITKYFAVLFAKNNIRINAISPGGVINKKLQSNSFIKNYSKRVPLNRMARVEDLFTTLVYISSDYSSYLTGQNIIVDGGLSLK